MTSPKGVIAIITGPHGDVCASETDFNLDGLGGFELAEAQAYRAKRAATFKLFRDYCHADIAKAMSDYHMQEVFRRMDGYKLSTIEVGHEQ